jgi:hypothetical protein
MNLRSLLSHGCLRLAGLSIGSIDLPGMEHASPTVEGSGSTVPDVVLVEAIDYGLLALGEIVSATIYQRIECTCQVKREEIPDRLESFHEALRGMLGAGTKVIEKQIAKNLYSRLGLNFTAYANWTIVEYFDYAKKARGGS